MASLGKKQGHERKSFLAIQESTAIAALNDCPGTDCYLLPKARRSTG